MQLLREQIQFPRPLRDVQLVARENREAAGLGAAPDREREAYERGRRDAEQVLQGELARQRGDLQALQQGVLASLRQAMPQVVRECEDNLIALAIEVARKLVADLPTSAEMVEASVREALAQVEDAAEMQIQLHPEDLAVLRRAGSPLLNENEGPEKITFAGSPEVSRGGCLVRTRFGVVDTRRETKLELLKQSLAV